MFVVLVKFRGSFWCPFTHAKDGRQADQYEAVAMAAGYAPKDVKIVKEQDWVADQEKKRRARAAA